MTIDGRREQDVVDEADDRGEARIAAVFGHVGAGENADRRADDDAHDGEDEAADDGVGEAAGAARRRRVGGEHLEGQAREAVPQKRRQDEEQPHGAERVAKTDSAMVMALRRRRRL